MLTDLRQGEGQKVRGRESSSYLCGSNAAHHTSLGHKGRRNRNRVEKWSETDWHLPCFPKCLHLNSKHLDYTRESRLQTGPRTPHSSSFAGPLLSQLHPDNYTWDLGDLTGLNSSHEESGSFYLYFSTSWFSKVWISLWKVTRESFPSCQSENPATKGTLSYFAGHRVFIWRLCSTL